VFFVVIGDLRWGGGERALARNGRRTSRADGEVTMPVADMRFIDAIV
jgi:hypothetical protein